MCIKDNVWGQESFTAFRSSKSLVLVLQIRRLCCSLHRAVVYTVFSLHRAVVYTALQSTSCCSLQSDVVYIVM
jgi:hypothetical protein